MIIKERENRDKLKSNLSLVKQIQKTDDITYDALTNSLKLNRASSMKKSILKIFQG